ncbi:MAG: hypothetical protein IJT88_06755 [Kiritimatiellae bacterium]|nr:hypothetical protein [Kiritimatiellia bacterium]
MEKLITTTTERTERLDDAFVGLYPHSLDGKRRFTIPSDWREGVASEPLYVIPGFNTPCLHVFTARDMSERLKTARTVSIANVKAQQFLRYIFSKACRVVLDAQGRIRVSDSLLDAAGIKSQVILVGAANRFELWSPEKWQEQCSLLEQNSFEDVASSLGL